jgi:hypothetical protein
MVKPKCPQAGASGAGAEPQRGGRGNSIDGSPVARQRAVIATSPPHCKGSSSLPVRLVEGSVRRVVAPLALALLLAACAGRAPSPPSSNGPAADLAPEADLAMVDWRPPLQVVAGAEAAPALPPLRLPPGAHVFRFEVRDDAEAGWCGPDHASAGTLAGELAAGHRYRIASHVDDWNCAIAVWLEDTGTGELVDGTAPRSLGLTPRRPLAPETVEPVGAPGPRFAALEARAAAGDATAAYELGLWYLTGDPPLTRSDRALAQQWLERAAAEHAAARAMLQRLQP